MNPKAITENMTDELRRPWRTLRFDDVEYVAWEDAETVLKLLADEVVALRRQKAGQGKALGKVLETLYDLVAQSHPELQESDTSDLLALKMGGFPLN